MTATAPRICVLCKHFDGRARCRRPIRARRSLVHGIVTDHLNASAERERRAEVFLWSGRAQCGAEGKFFAERYGNPPGPSK